MKYLLIAFVFVVLLLSVTTHYYRETPETTECTLKHMSRIPEAQLSLLAHTCYQNWVLLKWRIGPSQVLAVNNPAFRAGIKRVCRARSELFFEGYDLSPFIRAGSEDEIYPIVFLPTVDAIKTHMKLILPKLRLI